MRIWNNRWARYAVMSVLAVACTAAIADARRFFRFWWRQPPAPAIENSDYTGEATRGAVRTICVEEGAITAASRVNLDDGTFSASVVDGVLLFPEAISLTGTVDDDSSSTTIDVDISLGEAQLFQTYFSSVFRAEGEATITDVETPVPVFLLGSIHEHTDEGVYHLRAGLRGYLRVEDPDTGKITYTLLRVRLNGEAAIPTDDVPDDVPLPE